MAHFIGIIQGNKQAISRCGTKKSGIKASINGWKSGCEIEVKHTSKGDCFTIIRTSGSNGAEFEREVVAQWSEEESL